MGLTRGSLTLTALVATHDPNLISMADTVLELRDGQIKGSA
jgi:ABC-type lipoprotein export system ATPase subunit